MRSALFLFAALDDTDMRWLATAGTVRRFGPGQTMIRRGAKLDGLMLILDGAAQVEFGARRLPRRAGECLGEISLVDTRPASANVMAGETTRALWVPGTALRRQFAADTGFAARCYRGIAILLANRLREAGAGQDEAALDDIVLGGMARAGERFRLLLDYTEADPGSAP